MQLVDDEDVETMITLYYRNRSGQITPIQLFAELPDVELTGDFTPLSEEHGVQDLCTMVPRAYVDRRTTESGININLNGTHVDHRSQWAHASEFLEYPNLLPAHRLTADPEHVELFMGQNFATNEDCVFSIKRGRQKAIIGGYKSHLSRGHKYGRKFYTFRYPYAHVIVACARASINAEQYINEVYTHECTLYIWGNEFPVLCNLSTWEVPPLTFELVLDKGLHKKSKGHLQV
ncbi:hypothetical protein GOBAR_DD09313 [Gossypium barbadense]|nr:hypothetical protein GOBAR_DD09313 [Gossypium barbadense]